MPVSLGFSLYLSTFEAQWPTMQKWAHTHAPVFLSLNMGKGQADPQEAERICHIIADSGLRIIADVSTETVELFGEPDLLALAKRLKIWALRIDFGFTAQEIAAMAAQMPIVLNASTTYPEDAKIILAGGDEVFAMHNFYPRLESGMDRDVFENYTRNLHDMGLKVQGFIPGDSMMRGPVYEGLPTLEEHRYVLPSAAFVDMVVNYHMDDLFVGDPGISEKEQERIAYFIGNNVISVPAELDPAYEYLYNEEFTCRVDSPRAICRFFESRTTKKIATPPAPENNLPRPRGTVTMDNSTYDVYAGEVELVRKDLKADTKVNVIGHVPENAHLLMDCIHGDQKFRLVRP